MARARSGVAGKIPVGKILDVLSEGKEAADGANEQVRIRVHVDSGCSRELVCAVRDSLVAERAGGIVEVRPLEWGRGDEIAPDVALVLLGSQTENAADVASSYARCGVPVAFVAETTLAVPAMDLPQECEPYVGVVCASSADALPDKLAQWLVGATDKDLALAANFPFCRAQAVKGLIDRCALENAAVGAITLIKGADLPVMTTNEAKLALDIAAAYGRGIEPMRAVELAGVLGAGYAYRAVARTLTDVLPGLEHIIKAAMGYAGAVTTGNAMRLRFEVEDGTLFGGAEKTDEAPGALMVLPKVPARVSPSAAAFRQAPAEPSPRPAEAPVAQQAEPEVEPEAEAAAEDYLVFDEDGQVHEEHDRA